MSAPRFAPLMLSALCLSGCAAGAPGEPVGRYPAARPGEDRALASLPAAAGRVVTVRRIPYANGFGQEIVLDGPRAMSGENRIIVQALTTASTGLRGQGAEELRLGPPTDTEVAAEIDRALPGVTMRVAAAPERGEDGAVGYATGAVGRLSCVYAWQYLAPARPLSLLEGAAGTGALPVSVRVRLCREQPLAAVVASLRGLRVTRPDGTAEPAGLRPSTPGGDALTAAVGPSSAEEAAAATAVLRAGDAPDAERPADPAVPARARHGRAHVRPIASARPRAPRAVARAQVHPRRVAVRHVRDEAPDLVGATRVPLPGDAAADAAPVRPAAQAQIQAPAPRASAPDAMPMPR